MACFQSRTDIGLAAREAITLPDVKGATLRVTRGTLWLTQEGDRKDVVLRAGDNWVVEAAGDTVVESQDTVTFSIVGRHGAVLPVSRARLPGWSPAVSGFLRAAARGRAAAPVAFFLGALEKIASHLARTAALARARLRNIARYQGLDMPPSAVRRALPPSMKTA